MSREVSDEDLRWTLGVRRWTTKVVLEDQSLLSDGEDLRLSLRNSFFLKSLCTTRIREKRTISGFRSRLLYLPISHISNNLGIKESTIWSLGNSWVTMTERFSLGVTMTGRFSFVRWKDTDLIPCKKKISHF